MNWSFESDNLNGAHARVIECIMEANNKQHKPYGDDDFTRRATQLLQQAFAPQADVFFVSNGTAANVLAMQTLLRPYEGIVCTKMAHINSHECGAPERFVGAKCLSVDCDHNAKLGIDGIEQYLSTRGFTHAVQPKVISITQITELGGIYSKEEIGQLCEYAHANNLLVHMDGARLANAAASLDCSLSALSFELGVDVVSFGGTKNGLISADAIIFNNDALAFNFQYIHKQGMQMLSKMRFQSAQFIAYMENELWRENALHANRMLARLLSQLRTIEEVKILNHAKGNILIADIPARIHGQLREKYPFHTLGANQVARLVTDYQTQEHHVDGFIDHLKTLLI